MVRPMLPRFPETVRHRLTPGLGSSVMTAADCGQGDHERRDEYGQTAQAKLAVPAVHADGAAT